MGAPKDPKQTPARKAHQPGNEMRQFSTTMITTTMMMTSMMMMMMMMMMVMMVMVMDDVGSNSAVA